MRLLASCAGGGMAHADSVRGPPRVCSEALRRGLRELEMHPKPRTPFRTRSVDLGRVRIASIDNIGEVLAIAEGEDFA